MPTGQIHIDIKTSITTSGPHNGIIVQSGIQSGSNITVWPCNLNGAPTSLSANHIKSIQVNPAIQWTDVDPEKRLPESPVYSFSNNDTPPDDFLAHENVRLNVFKTV